MQVEQLYFYANAIWSGLVSILGKTTDSTYRLCSPRRGGVQLPKGARRCTFTSQSDSGTDTPGNNEHRPRPRKVKRHMKPETQGTVRGAATVKPRRLNLPTHPNAIRAPCAETCACPTQAHQAAAAQQREQVYDRPCIILPTHIHP